ncbi:glycosyltransferase family 2 protein [Methanobrevibacter filiformis]|uniref:N-acetylglucosaminyl-diphospho-decaprenol L-rhamnosyltransferase n=1 Tax=Methanobrevibacter filiformis TaxID=55758 RepID=A0A166EVI5_9EURY|nr:glycosyltransferase family 2 protein [Methanobrevibacter filiformis]KZX17061.1 N-acetylglucosaminyl-diphospho-decaprenol L-rhamnosyltransferase [Methanobrevibacter filiformis]
MKVSVIIPNFNGKHYLKTCFDSLIAQSVYIKEIIVIDNGSTDRSQDFIKEFTNKYDYFKLIENKTNEGFSIAINQGIMEASADFVFLLNNDVEVKKDAIKNLLIAIKKDSNIFSASSLMLQFNNRELIDDAGDMYSFLGYTRKLGLNKNINSYDFRQDIFSSCGGAALYRRSIFDEIGYFDENFFAYMEDVDIGYRARIFGYKNILVKDSIVYHYGSGTSGSQYNKFKIRLAARNNVFVPYKNMPIIQFICNFIFLAIGFLIKFIFFLKKGYGLYYLSGLKEGFTNLDKIDKVKHEGSNIKNYLNIQGKLILNTFRF